MIRHEARLQVKFGHFLKSGGLQSLKDKNLVGTDAGYGAVFELKAVQRGALPFNAVKEHQIDALLHVKHGVWYFKIPDDSVGVKPFDCLGLMGLSAWIVVFYGSRKPRGYMIDIDVFLAEREQSLPRKSLTEMRAREVCAILLPLLF